MIGRKKKAAPVQRNPHINRQKQSAFQYSSNRSQAERTNRENPDAEGKFAIRLKLAAFKLVHGLAVLAFFGIIFLLSLLLADPKLNAGDQQLLRSQETYDTAIADIVGNDFMSHSKITINRTEIGQKIADKFPELTDIDVTTPLFSPSVKISAKVSQPNLVLIANGKNFIVDARGVALIDATDMNINTDALLRVEDQTGAPIEAGKPALTSSQMQFINEVKRQSEAKQLTLEQLFLVAGGGELDVKYLEAAYIVKYNLYENAKKSFGTFYATKEYVEKSNAVPSQYIDVRVPERAYTK